MSQITTYVDLGQVKANMGKLSGAIAEKAKAVVDRNFIEMENFAKSNASWTDRTGNARRSIKKVDKSDRTAILYYLIIGVNYGVWLEIAHQGKFQILRPTMTIFEPKLQKELKKIGGR